MKKFLFSALAFGTLATASTGFASDHCDQEIRLVASNNGLLHRHPHNNDVGSWGNIYNSSHHLSENLWTIKCVENSSQVRGSYIRLVSNNGSMLHRHPHNNNVGAWGNHRDLNNRLPQNLWRIESTRQIYDICDSKIRLVSDANSMLHYHPHNASAGAWGHYNVQSNRLPENNWTVKCD